MRHPLAELTDLVAEVLALAVDLRAEVMAVASMVGMGSYRAVSVWRSQRSHTGKLWTPPAGTP